MQKELNKHPFIERSTLLLTHQGYTLPIGIFLDANLYPKCDNNPPFYISDIIKEGQGVNMFVRDNRREVVIVISISNIDDTQCDYILGHGFNNTAYCGSVLLSKQAKDFFAAIPTIRDIPSDSLVFTASAIRPRGTGNGQRTQSGQLLYDGKPVKEIKWGDNLTGGVLTPGVVDVSDNQQTPISEITVNGVTLKGEHIFITPTRNSVVRIINDNAITVGRLTDL